MKILHTADWHIGNFPGPEIDGENARYLDICRCLDSLTKTAFLEEPDIIIISGDVFHQERVWASRGLRESRTAIHYLRELAGVAPVCVLRGTPNHDGEEQFNSLRLAFANNPDVYIMDKPDVITIYTGKEGRGDAVNVAALPGFDRGYYRARHPGLSKEEENEVFTAELEKLVLGLKAQCAPGLPTILSTHFTVTGATTESGQTQLFAQFEPVIEPATLAAADFDLVCLGHIHRPQQLEGCKNTFYSGGIMGFNFNDEEQPRGFYIHEFPDEPKHAPGNNPPIPALVSRFIETPSRQLRTLYFNDPDIRDINNGIIRIGPKVEDKIVRVLYNCTDESHKALNKPLLEKAIYDLGAFWVQEITPEKIAVSVNRDGLASDNTPEDNLREYLEEKEVEPERISAYIELARPIIAEALESTMTEAKTGLLVPVEIEVKNYRNYVEERFEYDGIRFCTINGENGAGKSSLFMDAILDALFEEPREGDLTGWIRNDPEARSGSIKFTFRLGDRLYRVTRTRQKSGKATLNLAECVEGEWLDRSKERYKDTQAEIENTIGMDSLTLKACALIMQDQYGLFLQADKEARMAILANILGLGIYGIMEAKASNEATETNRVLRKTKDIIEEISRGLPDAEDLREQSDVAKRHINTLEAEIAERDKVADSIRYKLQTTTQAAERARKIGAEIQDLEQKKRAAEGNLVAQETTIKSADELLVQEPEIAAGIERYNALLEQEKELLTSKAQYDAKLAEWSRVSRLVEESDTEIEQLSRESEGLKARKSTHERALAEEPALKEKAAEYETVKAGLAELEGKTAEYISLSDVVTKAEREVEAIRSATLMEHSRLTMRINDLKARAALMENSECPLNGNAVCRFLFDAIEAKRKIPEAEAALEEWTKQQAQVLSDAEKRLSAASEARKALMYRPEDVEAKKAALVPLEAFYRQYSELALHKERLATVNDRLEQLTQRLATLSAKAAQYRKQVEDLNAEVSKLATAARRHEELVVEITDAKRWLEREKLLPAARERKSTAQVRAIELITEIDSYEATIRNKEAERRVEHETASGADAIQAELAEVEKVISSRRETIQALSRAIGAIAQQLEKYNDDVERLAGLRDLAMRQSEQSAGYEELKKAFSQDGIPHNIIRTMIPIFEATATNILGQMSGGHMSVEFVTEKVLKSNNKKEVTTLDIIINDASTGALPYMSRSGGERVKAALSVILALSEIKSTKAGVQLGFLFIDEPPFLDGPGVQAYCDALEAIQSRYSDLKVMAITHDPAMKSRFPQNVDVVKTTEGSKLIYA